MYLCSCSPQCLQVAQDQAAVRRQIRYVNGDSTAGQAGILAQPLACSCRTTEACKILSLEGVWIYGVTVVRTVTLTVSLIQTSAAQHWFWVTAHLY